MSKFKRNTHSRVRDQCKLANLAQPLPWLIPSDGGMADDCLGPLAIVNIVKVAFLSQMWHKLPCYVIWGHWTEREEWERERQRQSEVRTLPDRIINTQCTACSRAKTKGIVKGRGRRQEGAALSEIETVAAHCHDSWTVADRDQNITNMVSP